MTGTVSDVRLSFVPRVLATWDDASEQSRTFDGSLLFVDVSGYTALSERLDRRGRIGAELLTEVLDELFGRLLDLAERLGGDLLKFGGDAILVMFDGLGHEVRAAAAAWQMQRALRHRVAVGGLGSLSLRASMGVAAGQITLIAAGPQRQELVVVGPVVDEVLRCESAAHARQIRVSSSVADACGHELVTSDDDGFVLTQAPSRVPSFDQAPLASARSVEPLLQARLGRNAVVPTSSHGVVVAGFIAFKGLSAVGSGRTLQVIDDLITRSINAADRHDVSIVCVDIGPDGGKVFLVGGAMDRPASDAFDRVVLAATEVVDAPNDLTVSCGVAAGRAFVAPLGSATQRVVAVVGDTINTAARVAAKAERERCSPRRQRSSALSPPSGSSRLSRSSRRENTIRFVLAACVRFTPRARHR